MRQHPFASKKITQHRTPHLKNVIEDLQTGNAIPFIGAGFSANDLNGSSDYGKVIAAVEKEIRELNRDLRDHEDRPKEALIGVDHDDRTQFIRCLEQHYLSGRRFHPTQLELDGREDTELVWLGDKQIREFRALLAEFIIHLTKKYNSGVSSENMFYFSSFNKVYYEETSDNIGKFPAFAMLEALDNLHHSIGEDPKFAESLQIKTAYSLFHGAFKFLRERYDTNTGRRDDDELHIDNIIWLTDLLWLTISIWLPLHPTSRELAAEISCVSDRKSRSSERRMIRAAECFSDPDELATYITQRFRKTDESKFSDALIMDTHLALACAALLKPKKHLNLPKVLYMTNFDRGVERALEKLIEHGGSDTAMDQYECYRVVYPILVQRTTMLRGSKNAKKLKGKSVGQEENHNKEFDLHWVARDWHRQTSQTTLDEGGDYSRTPKWIIDDDSEHKFGGHTISNLEVLTDRFDGHIVIKLHGAPLELLPSIEDGPNSNLQQEVRHYLVVSEHQYIDTIIRSSETTPSWLTELLRDRYISFLGYSIEDWNVRLHLAQQPMFTGDSTALRRSAIVRHASEAEKTLFERLGIGLASSELGQLVREIKDDKNIKSMLSLAGFGPQEFKYLNTIKSTDYN